MSERKSELSRHKCCTNPDRTSTSQIINNQDNVYISSVVIVNQNINHESVENVEISKFDGFPYSSEIFVGRMKEIEKLSILFQKYQKIIITGIGGIGKTRLVTESCLYIHRLIPIVALQLLGNQNLEETIVKINLCMYLEEASHAYDIWDAPFLLKHAKLEKHQLAKLIVNVLQNSCKTTPAPTKTHAKINRSTQINRFNN